MLLFYFCLLVSIIFTNGKNVGLTPRSLVDDAKAQINELRGAIGAAIFTAFGDVSLILNKVYLLRREFVSSITIDFFLESINLEDRLTQLQDLGVAAGVDTSACTSHGLDSLQAISSNLQGKLQECTSFASAQSMAIQSGAEYLLDVIINEVEVFDYQVEVCGESLDCLAPILAQVELAHVSLNQKIEVEIDNTQALADNLRAVFETCATNGKSEAMSQGSNVVDEATACTNDLIGS